MAASTTNPCYSLKFTCANPRCSKELTAKYGDKQLGKNKSFDCPQCKTKCRVYCPNYKRVPLPANVALYEINCRHCHKTNTRTFPLGTRIGEVASCSFCRQRFRDILMQPLPQRYRIEWEKARLTVAENNPGSSSASSAQAGCTHVKTAHVCSPECFRAWQRKQAGQLPPAVDQWIEVSPLEMRLTKFAQIPSLPSDAPMAPQPPGMGPKLYGWQRRSLYQMLRIERGTVHVRSAGYLPYRSLKVVTKGGVLCDEVGMGKTAQVLGLILSTQPQVGSNPIEFSRTEKTLVVCPEHLCAQWRNEAQRFCGNSLDVYIIDGSRRSAEYEVNGLREGIRNAHIVVLSMEFFGGNHYTWIRSHVWYGWTPLDEKWRRVVFDECQEPGQRTGKSMNRFRGLAAQNKWCISGTPFPTAQAAHGIIALIDVDRSELGDVNLYADWAWHLLKRAIFIRNTKKDLGQEWIDAASPLGVAQQVIKVGFTEIEEGFYRQEESKYLYQLHKSSSTSAGLWDPQFEALRQLCCHVGVCKIWSSPLGKGHENMMLAREHGEKGKATGALQHISSLTTDAHATKGLGAFQVQSLLQWRDNALQSMRGEQIKYRRLQSENRGTMVFARNTIKLCQLYLDGVPYDSVKKASFMSRHFDRNERDERFWLVRDQGIDPKGVNRNAVGLVKFIQRYEQINYAWDYISSKSSPDVRAIQARMEEIIESCVRANEKEDMKIEQKEREIARFGAFHDSHAAPGAQAGADEKTPGDDDEENTCSVCLDELPTVFSVTPCAHAFCPSCIEACLKKKATCPLCVMEVTLGQCSTVRRSGTASSSSSSSSSRVPEQDQLVQEYGSKPAALVRLVVSALAQEANAKLIVFSQWHGMLSLIRDTLVKNNIRCVYLVDDDRMETRSKQLAEFSSDPTLSVLLLSTTHQASGLNLQCANHIVFMDQAGKSAVDAIAIETQAVGRVLRLGQTRKVYVTHLVLQNTLEEKLFDGVRASIRAGEGDLLDLRLPRASDLLRETQEVTLDGFLSTLDPEGRAAAQLAKVFEESKLKEQEAEVEAAGAGAGAGAGTAVQEMENKKLLPSGKAGKSRAQKKQRQPKRPSSRRSENKENNNSAQVRVLGLVPAHGVQRHKILPAASAASAAAVAGPNGAGQAHSRNDQPTVERKHSKMESHIQEEEEEDEGMGQYVLPLATQVGDKRKSAHHNGKSASAGGVEQLKRRKQTPVVTSSSGAGNVGLESTSAQDGGQDHDDAMPGPVPHGGFVHPASSSGSSGSSAASKEQVEDDDVVLLPVKASSTTHGNGGANTSAATSSKAPQPSTPAHAAASKAAGVVSSSSSSSSSSSAAVLGEKPMSTTCPVCLKQLVVTNLQLNQHIDECLNSKFISSSRQLNGRDAIMVID